MKDYSRSVYYFFEPEVKVAAQPVFYVFYELLSVYVVMLVLVFQYKGPDVYGLFLIISVRYS